VTGGGGNGSIRLFKSPYTKQKEIYRERGEKPEEIEKRGRSLLTRIGCHLFRGERGGGGMGLGVSNGPTGNVRGGRKRLL